MSIITSIHTYLTHSHTHTHIHIHTHTHTQTHIHYTWQSHRAWTWLHRYLHRKKTTFSFPFLMLLCPWNNIRYNSSVCMQQLNKPQTTQFSVWKILPEFNSVQESTTTVFVEPKINQSSPLTTRSLMQIFFASVDFCWFLHFLVAYNKGKHAVSIGANFFFFFFWNQGHFKWYEQISLSHTY